MMYEYDKRRIIERKKIQYREKLEFHTKNVILQAMVSLCCVTCGVYAGQRKNIIVPLVLAPMVSESVKTLTKHETERQRCKKVLNKLERS